MSIDIKITSQPSHAMENNQKPNQNQHLTQQERINMINKQIQPQKTIKSQKTLSPKELKRVIDKINENVARLNKEVKFVYNETLKALVVKVIDEKTGKVIREIPPQEVINLQKKLSEIVGIIFDSKEVANDSK